MTDASTEIAVAPEIQEAKLASEQKFIVDLAKLLKNDRGKAAILRRNVGNTVAESKNMDWFFGFLRTQPIKRLDNDYFYNEEVYFLIATLFAWDKDEIEFFASVKDTIESKNDNFGKTLFAFKKKKCETEASQKTLDRRFNILLDADFDPKDGGELAFRLRQMTKRIITEKDPTLRINWPQLLHDLKFWNGDKKIVQKRWARSYYAPILNSTQDTTPESDNE